MIKKAIVEIGKTPSLLSGKPSEKESKEGEALKTNEKLKDNKRAKIAMERLIQLEK